MACGFEGTPITGQQQLPVPAAVPRLSAPLKGLDRLSVIDPSQAAPASPGTAFPPAP